LYLWVIRCALPAGSSGYPERRTTTPANATRSLARISTPLCVVVDLGCCVWMVLRMDNGPEFISHELTQWAAKQDTIEAFIPPGMPWHNGFVESFHNRLRDELLEDEMFDDPAHASHCLRLWSERYNTHHPHSSLGFIPPTEYANQWHQTQQCTQTDRS
ncbi:Integrase core domain-containing protein, partial [Actinobaculum suis]